MSAVLAGLKESRVRSCWNPPYGLAAPSTKGPWKGVEDVEYATLEWVAWYNSQRLMGPLGYIPPAEYEEQYREAQADLPVLVLN